MSDEQDYHPSSRFGGDMSRNEVEMDLSKFMEMLQENSALKDRIRELEDKKNDNPYHLTADFIKNAQPEYVNEDHVAL